MKKFLALLLSVVMVCSVAVPALAADTTDISLTGAQVNKVTFPDSEGHWAEESISRWALNGVVRGDPQGNMNPNKLLTRGEFSEMLVRLLGLSEKAANRFVDLKGSEWYADSILKVTAAGIMLGDELGNCNGNKPITRQETIVMFARAMGLKPVSNPDLSEYSDGNEVADWAAGYFAPLTKMGIINGTVPGQMVASPKININRASTLALLDKAVRIYITTPGVYEVNEPNGFVVVNVPAADDVTVSGQAGGVVITAGTNDADVALKDMTADTVRVDGTADVTLDGETEVGSVALNAEGDLFIGKDAAVEDLDVNAAAKIVNNGEVTNLNTNEDGVTFDGNAPETVNTAEDVEAAKDSKGNEVAAKGEEEEKPDNSGTTVTPSRPTSYKYKVKVESATGGKVTASLTQTNKAGETVTLTVTPDAQKGDTMPYVLKSLTVKNGDKNVTVKADKTFTMDEEGTYTVTAVFEQPIEEVGFFIADGDNKKSEDMEAFGYPAGNVPNWSLATHPYLFVGFNKRVEGYEISEFTITANGTKVELPWDAPNHWAAAYVNNEIPDIDPDKDADRLGLTGSAYTFVLTFKVNEAEYEFSCKYRDPAKKDQNFYTVTFQNGNQDIEREGVEGDVFTVPAADVVEGKYFTGWTCNGETVTQVTLGTADLTVKANYIDVETQTTATRPNGDPDSFNYSAAYTALGLTLKNNTLTVDAAELVKAETVAPEIVKTEDGVDYVFYGVEYTNKPAGATHAVVSYGKTLTEFDDVNKVAVGDTDSSDGGTSVYNGHLIDYLPVAYKENGVWNFFETGDTFTRYIKWMKGDEILGITKAVTTLKVEPATFTVTFKDGSKTVDTVTVDYNSAEWELAQKPEKAGSFFLGWFDGETEVKEPSVLTADLTLNAKWAPLTNMSDVKVSITGAAATLGVVATEYKNGAITYTVDEAKWNALTDEEKASLTGRLFVRVNFAVPDDVDTAWTFVGSTNNGESWRGVVEHFDAARLKAVGLDTTKDENGRITYLGQWFTIAEVKDGALILPESTTWTVVYKWWSENDAVKCTTVKLTREVKLAVAEENP